VIIHIKEIFFSSKILFKHYFMKPKLYMIDSFPSALSDAALFIGLYTICFSSYIATVCSGFKNKYAAINYQDSCLWCFYILIFKLIMLRTPYKKITCVTWQSRFQCKCICIGCTCVITSFVVEVCWVSMLEMAITKCEVGFKGEDTR
jgi:hypothetical protein